MIWELLLRLELPPWMKELEPVEELEPPLMLELLPPGVTMTSPPGVTVIFPLFEEPEEEPEPEEATAPITLPKSPETKETEIAFFQVSIFSSVNLPSSSR